MRGCYVYDDNSFGFFGAQGCFVFDSSGARACKTDNGDPVTALVLLIFAAAALFYLSVLAVIVGVVASVIYGLYCLWRCRGQGEADTGETQEEDENIPEGHVLLG